MAERNTIPDAFKRGVIEDAERLEAERNALQADVAELVEVLREVPGVINIAQALVEAEWRDLPNAERRHDKALWEWRQKMDALIAKHAAPDTEECHGN